MIQVQYLPACGTQTDNVAALEGVTVNFHGMTLTEAIPVAT